MNGKKGDDPVTDITVHRIPLFSPAADALIMEIVQLGGRAELERAFTLFEPPPLGQFEPALLQIRERLRKAARERGWEV